MSADFTTILYEEDGPVGTITLNRPDAANMFNAVMCRELRDCTIGDDGLELLAQRARCPRLRRLGLAGNRVSPAALEQLLESPLTQRLESLDLSASLDDEAALVLTRIEIPPRLSRLDLRRNDFTEQTLLAIANSPTLVAIRNIELEATPWGFAPASRQRLEERFGPEWYRT